MKFDFVYFGQTCLKYQVPLEIFVGLNEIYEKRKKELPKANKQLAGKIEDEVSLYYSGPNNDKMHPHNFLPTDILQWFHSVFDHYTDWNRTGPTQKSINSVWVNEMKANEYNPFHHHMGTKGHLEGLSSVMMLKKPNTYGVEYSRAHVPTNGTLELIAGAGILCFNQLRVDMKVGDLFIFPYDVQHGVYPFNGTTECRRTLSYNCDLGNDLENLFKGLT